MSIIIPLLFTHHFFWPKGKEMLNGRRVVITGMGVVAPNGIGIDKFWDSLIHGRSGVRTITHFDASSYPCQIAAEVPNFDPANYVNPKTAKRLDRFAFFCLAAALLALEDAEIGIPVKDPYRIGVFIGTAMGGVETGENQHLIFAEKGLRRIAPFTVEAVSTHSASGLISQSLIIKGPNTTISSGCNSGLDACYLGYNAIRAGDAEVMVVGGGEAPVTPYILSIFSAVGVLSTQNGNPELAVKPYDINARGMVLGEGGGAIVMEELHHAISRGAKIYGEILGYSSLTEAYMFGTKTDTEVMAKAFKEALDKSHLNSGDIDYINSHGNGILEYDVGETESIKKAFGELAYKIPVSSIKPITGQSLSATGIYQVITVLLAIKNGIIPPTINHTTPAPGCDLNYVPNHFVKKDVSIALTNAHGFGGRHTVLILGKFTK
jgi:3-oxoacyl-[acyl-carrier-protein] synthase II